MQKAISRLSWFFLVAFIAWLLIRAPFLHLSVAFAAVLAIAFLLLFRRKYLLLLRTEYIVSLAIILRLVWGLVAGTQPFSDFGGFWNLAQQIAQGSGTSFAAKAPASVFYYSLLARISDSLIVVYISNALLGGISTWLIFRISQIATQNIPSSRAAALLFAFYPGSVIYSPVVSSEALMMPFCLLAALLIFQRYKDASGLSSFQNDSSKSCISLILIAFFLALADSARHAAILFTFSVLVFWALIPPPSFIRRLRDCLLLVVLLYAFLSPQALYNFRHRGVFSFSGYSLSGANFLLGTNQETGGAYNDADMMQFLRETEELGLREASSKAKHQAVSRILKDFPGFIRFALTTKFDNMWSDTRLLFWAIHRARLPAEYRNTVLNRFLSFILSTYFLMLWILLLSSIILLFRRWNPFHIFMANYILLTALVHLVCEAQGRYHLPIMPFVCILATSVLAGDSERTDSEKSAKLL